MTEEYESHKIIGECPYIGDSCERLYCRSHRSLYRLCETSIPTHDGAGQSYYELRECPACLEDQRRKDLDHEMAVRLARTLP